MPRQLHASHPYSIRQESELIADIEAVSVALDQDIDVMRGYVHWLAVYDERK